MSLLKTSGDFFFKYRNALFPVIFLSLFFVSAPAPVLLLPQDLLLITLGITLVIFGQGFRLAVIGYAYIKRGGKEGKVYADDLVVRGFYAHSRNPMYVGNISVVLGLCILYGSFWSLFVMIPLFLFIYLSITVAEETYLRARFGAQYEAYEKNVPRFWPNFKGIKDSLKEFTYDGKKALRKDYGNVFQNLFAAVFIAAWKFYFYAGNAVFYVAAPAFALLVAFYIWARFLKKTARLAS